MKALALLFGLAAFAQDFKLTDPQGKTVSLPSGQGRVTVVTFISTVCPVSNSYHSRMTELYRDYSAKSVQFLFVNSNQNEPAAAVQEHARQAGFPFPVYRDIGNVVADRLHAQHTPESVVIDAAGRIRYHGGIDDAQNPARVTRKALRLALDAVLSGGEVAAAETKTFGCSIKRARRAL